MAKSFRPASSTPTAWLTAAEQRVLDSTVGTALATATRNQLQAAMKQARGLRDKWRDLFNRQSIASKKGPARPNDPANTRSLEKAELFGAAVKRLEARIDELVADVSAAVGGKRGGKAAGRKAGKAVTKSARQAGHRATRSSIRETLSEAVASINAAGRRLLGVAQPAPKRPAARPAAKPKAATSKAVRSTPAAGQPKAAAKPAGKPAGKMAKAATSKKARRAGGLKTLAASGAGQAVQFDAKKQRSAKARATATRIKLDGLSTRRRGHTLVSGKRKQARRDGR